jgi:hypothetical protein
VQLEAPVARVLKDERHPVVRHDVTQRARDGLQQRFPVEASHDRVVHLQEDPPTFLGVAQLAGSVLHAALKILAQLPQLPGQSPRRNLGHDGRSQASEDLDLLFRPLPGLVSATQERAEGVSFGRGERDSGVRDLPDPEDRRDCP